MTKTLNLNRKLQQIEVIVAEVPLEQEARYCHYLIQAGHQLTMWPVIVHIVLSHTTVDHLVFVSLDHNFLEAAVKHLYTHSATCSVECFHSASSH